MRIITLLFIFSNKQIENSNSFGSFTDYNKTIFLVIITHQREPVAGISSLPVPLRIRNHLLQVDKQAGLEEQSGYNRETAGTRYL